MYFHPPITRRTLCFHPDHPPNPILFDPGLGIKILKGFPGRVKVESREARGPPLTSRMPNSVVVLAVTNPATPQSIVVLGVTNPATG